MSNVFMFTILGEPASKANSRMLVTIKGLPAFKEFQKQCPTLDPLMEGDLSVTMTIYYKTRRPDLDESVVLDCMQGYIFKNDRQVKEKHVYHGLDKTNPRCEISVSSCEESD